jgi:hypothetical protein
MSDAELKGGLALADLIRDLAHAQEARKKRLAAIVRFVQRREASGPANDVMEQISRDKKLCKLLVDFEDRSEIIGIMEFVRDLRMKAALSKEIRTARLPTRSHAGGVNDLR